MATKGSAGLGKSVCVVGAGALGLVAVKNFLEEGYDVTCFERNSYIGGIWHMTMDEKQTSVLAGTVSNISKQGMAYSDFPFPDAFPLHPNAKQMQDYVDSYATHFDLNRHIKLSTSVKSIVRDVEQQIWRVATTTMSANSTSEDVQTFVFDRLIIATGAYPIPVIPHVTSLDTFKGEVLHSQSFKDPSKYAGKTVLVVGMGTSAGDSVTYLANAGAKKIHVSHRRRYVLVPRILNGKAMDHSLSFRIVLIGGFMRRIFPNFTARMVYKTMVGWRDGAFPDLKDHPSFASTRPLPSLNPLIPLVSDTLPGLLSSGRAETHPGISYIAGPNSVTLTDGTTLSDIDVILFCTGFHSDLASLLPSSCNPSNPALAPDNFAALPKAFATRVPRLYRDIISLQHPHALAFLGHSHFMRGQFGLYDLISMALAQLWSGNFPLPSQAVMEREADARYDKVVADLKEGDVAHTGFHTDLEYDVWLNAVAGTGLYERVGSWMSPECWKLWWRDPKVYRMLIDGPITAHTLRLFETGRGRKPWKGARAAIEKANRDVEVLEEAERARKRKSKIG